MMNNDRTPTSYCYCADVFSYPLTDALGGIARLFNLDMDGSLFNRKQLTNDLEEQVSPFLSSILGRIVDSLFIIQKKINSLLSIKPHYLCGWVVRRIPLFFNLLCLSSNNKEDKHFAKKDAKEGTARALRNVRTILPYKRLAKVLQILRSENALVETARSAGHRSKLSSSILLLVIMVSGSGFGYFRSLPLFNL